MKKGIVILISCTFLLSTACNPTATPSPTQAALATTFSMPTAVQIIPPLPAPTETARPSSTVQPNGAGSSSTPNPQSPTTNSSPSSLATQVQNPTTEATNQTSAGQGEEIDINAQKYIDDRSSALSVMASLFNAINRQEYLRAFSYWETGGSINGTPFSSFQAGYEKTKSVRLFVGQITGDAGAGNQYFTVPVGLISTDTSGIVSNYNGCYLLHLANPDVQGTLPFQSIGVQKGEAQQIATGTSPADQLSNACAQAGFPQGHSLSSSPTYAVDDISSNRYLDDRSDAVQVIRSFYNSINRHEYLRAYSYWEPGVASSQLATFQNFSNGYADTQSVKLITGQITSDAGAGQYHYSVPVTLIAQTKSGSVQTFVGCYVLHISNPQIQGTPPFNPLAIISAAINQVQNNSNTSALIAAACQ